MNRFSTGIPIRPMIFFIAIMFGFTQTGIAQNGLTPTQVSQIKSVGSVYLSPDGNTAAYTVLVPADPFKNNAPASAHLYLLDSQTGSTKPFITGRSVSGVAFRPNHNSITYLDKQDGDNTRSIYEISLDGGEAQKLYSFKTNIIGYEWAADGNHIVFRAAEPKESGDSPLPYQPEIYEENLTNTWAYIQNIAREDHNPDRIPVAGTVYTARWSPDQTKIAVAAAPTPLVDDSFMAQTVYIIDHKTREILTEVDHTGKLGQFTWSPDGKKIAMIAAADINDPIAGRLKMINPENGSATLLQKDFKGMFEQIEWTDDNTLHYLASKGVWSEFGSIRSDGSRMNVIIPTGGPILKAFAHASNGTHVFDVSTPTHPDELYLMKKGQKSPKRITNSNPWLDEVELGKQEVITYTTKDGFEIEGLLIYPVDYQEGTQYPLINVIHGGPEAHYDNGWLTSYSMAGQMGAADGFAVFYPNYRGSTGRGIQFAMSSQGDLAGAEFDDIVEGVDYLIDKGIADPSKVGVTGGSYGGYATGWLSTKYSDRFAAGVMFVGISNNLSKWGTSDIPEELYHVHARKRIWEDYQDYLERSPIYHVDNAKTPLLIMHGKEDTRVDPGQSYELYRHIKTRTDTPVRLVLYPGEGHGNRNATAQYDYSLRSMRWFNQYLKGEEATRPDSELEIEEMRIDN
ncbi:MAG: S9 family peptidase [Gracilimonas sp.]|uniref:alpha/beta hydrolase family protein n=1 Tax=Gracilimonas sp. TaxID=1974203 RepID=UPI0019B0650A|nr:S9 family peptidase [Gracilimonas sp.]MBD3617561.1 S9 family peptidase [Gracilimonas sp.]